MITEPEVLRCPNCGAALELVDGRCRWCHDPVTMEPVGTPPASGPDSEADGEGDGDGEDDPGDDAGDDDPAVRAGEEQDRLALGDNESKLPIPGAWLMSSVAWITFDPVIQAFLEARPELVEQVRGLLAAVQAAGTRVAGTGIEVKELLDRGFAEVYEPDELWTLELAADLVVWWTGFDGVDRDMHDSMRFELSRDYWKGHVERRRRHWWSGGTAGAGKPEATSGAAALQSLRSVVPHRS
jgi:hypothetical protein